MTGTKEFDPDNCHFMIGDRIVMPFKGTPAIPPPPPFTCIVECVSTEQEARESGFAKFRLFGLNRPEHGETTTITVKYGTESHEALSALVRNRTVVKASAEDGDGKFILRLDS